MIQDLIAVINAGGDASGLAREIRAHGVYSEIYPCNKPLSEFNQLANLKGIIICGDEIPPPAGIYDLGIPIYDNSQVGALSSGLKKTWSMENFIADQIELLKNQIGGGRALLALSGGVDSSVVAALLSKTIGDRLVCVHVNHGLLRKGEPEQVLEVFGREFAAKLIYVDAADRFLDKLEGVSDPEEKRKIIGAEFIKVFEEEARKLDGIEFLAQGTIYPDIAESGTDGSKNVKAHHNVGGLPDDLKFELVEPLKYLFKDEVRACGKALGLPDEMVYRQPFPGPGLGVRCLGEITRDRLEAVRESDAILREEFKNAGLEGKIWQYFILIPDIKSVGTREGERSCEWPAIIRAVNTVDAMTATVERLDFDLLQKITQRIINEVKGVGRVCYDLTPKPTGTIEWE